MSTSQGNAQAAETQNDQLYNEIKRLSRQIAYVSELNRLSSAMFYAASKIVLLCSENQSPDETFVTLAAQAAQAAHAKIKMCDAWLNENEQKMRILRDQYTGRVDG